MDLAPLTGEFADLVARFPLPDGVPDAIVNKGDLAVALSVSNTTVSNWLAAGLPSIERGGNGRDYRFRLSVAYAWHAARRADEEASRAASEEAARQLQMSLLGGEEARPSQEALSLSDRKKLLELEYEHTRVAAQRRELLRFGEVTGAFEAVFAAIRDALDALPDRLGRECGLDGAQIERAQAACDDALAAAVREVGAVIGDGGGRGDI